MEMQTSEVTISKMSRAGSLSYREGNNEVPFRWELGGTSVAFIWGTKKHVWDVQHPWAAGRQSEIYDSVAKEVIRQKSANCGFRIDLDGGTITIL
jgi:hypothetical protein